MEEESRKEQGKLFLCCLTVAAPDVNLATYGKDVRMEDGGAVWDWRRMGAGMMEHSIAAELEIAPVLACSSLVQSSAGGPRPKMTQQ